LGTLTTSVRRFDLLVHPFHWVGRRTYAGCTTAVTGSCMT
jgi:hypothetical protein